MDKTEVWGSTSSKKRWNESVKFNQRIQTLPLRQQFVNHLLTAHVLLPRVERVCLFCFVSWMETEHCSKDDVITSGLPRPVFMKHDLNCEKCLKLESVRATFWATSASLSFLEKSCLYKLTFLSFMFRHPQQFVGNTLVWPNRDKCHYTHTSQLSLTLTKCGFIA